MCCVLLTWNAIKNVEHEKGVRACLHGGGGPHIGEVTRLGGVTRQSIYSLILI